MILKRPGEERGRTRISWLDSRHSFSFGEYYDPRQMGFGPLRVINEDWVAPGAGFPTHGHRDMEIVTYVIEGALEHKDSLGTGSIIRPGEVQRMSAGTGVMHSEFNGSKDEPVHFLQIWILPDRSHQAPSYEQKAYPEAERRGKLRLVASPDVADGSTTIQQDARLHATLLAPGEQVEHAFAPGRHGWVQVARGEVTVNGQTLRPGDGAAISDERSVALVSSGSGTAEVLLFDLA
jgi:quercetin 2,3-dioxygenase